MAREGFEQVLAVQDETAGLRGFLGLHDTSAGPAFGGIRRFAYRDEAAALMDCLRLSKAMSYKCALNDIPGGGAKLVVLERPEADLSRTYRAIGRTVEGLGGRYYAGPDVGTGWQELSYVAEETSYVTRPGSHGPGDLSEATAAGVFASIAAGLRSRDGSEDWQRRRVVLQGVGRVGERLAQRLASLGVHVMASETDLDRRAELEGLLDVEWIEPSSEFTVDVDVFAPCAMGGVLHDLSIQRLSAKVVCGAANTPLARSMHADALHRRGVLFIPDILATAGALIRGATFHLDGEAAGLDEIESRIGATVEGFLLEARRLDVAPWRLAKEEAERRIHARRERRVADSLVPGVRRAKQRPEAGAAPNRSESSVDSRNSLSENLPT